MNSKKSIIRLLCFTLFLYVSQLYSQEKIYSGNPESSFENARKLAFNKQRKQAQDTLNFILTKYPDNYEVRNFMATTYSWDGNYNKAREEFEYVLKRDSGNKETWIAAINNELWSDMPEKALSMTKEALVKFPDDEEILLQKAKAEENSNALSESLNTIEYLLAKNPRNKNAVNFKNSLNDKLRKNTIGVSSAVDIYSETFDPMQYHTLKYSRSTKYGSIIGKVNFNRRFEENGLQYEVDLYPKISKGLYAYLNLGFADSFLFPDVRYGAELHKSLPRSFEVSLGFRALKYAITTTIYTGSVSFYNGNNYWSFRPYITPGESGTSESGVLTYRRYRADAANYFGVSIGVGFSPEINQFNFSGSENTIVELKSQKVNLSYNFSSANKKHLWGTQFGVSHQEIIFDLGNYFWVYSLGVSWELKFK